MDGEKSSERACEGDAWVGVVRKKEKEMETGEVGFLFFVAWNGGRGRKNKDENGNVLPEWRLWAGGRLWGWYRKTCGGMWSLLVAAECLM